MKKRKKIIWKILISVLLIVTGYFLWGTAYHYFGGLYYRNQYKSRLAEKIKKQSAVYYFAASGNDASDGKSEKTAWQTITKLNELELNPGDSILFKGGEIFSGNILLDGKDLGTTGNPITLTSYGNTKAIIKAGVGIGIKAINSEGVAVTNLKVEGSGSTTNKGSALLLSTTFPVILNYHT